MIKYIHLMGLSKSSLYGLKVFSPDSIQNNDLDLLETFKFETKDFRKNDFLDKEVLQEQFTKRTHSVKPKKSIPSKKNEIKRLVETFCKKLDRTLMVKNDESSVTDIKWDRIDDFCNILRRIERSDERKVRWALYYLWRLGKTTITVKDVSDLLKEFKIKEIPKIIKKILKHEISSGLVAEFDDKVLKINHEIDDKLVWHYLGDEIGEVTRRSPGEIEKEILQLIDEGSYSATELSDFLLIDEATISRTLSKLRKSEKIILSSFGERGSRYYTTNCDNCPFGTTKAACRKEALAYIIDYFKKSFDVELSAPDFEGIEENQAILKIKRIVSVAKKEKNTKLESSISKGLAELLGTVVDNSLKIKTKKKNSPENITIKTNDALFRLPVLFHLGLYKGSQTSTELINEIMKNTKGIPKAERIKIKRIVEDHSKQFLRFAGINEAF